MLRAVPGGGWGVEGADFFFLEVELEGLGLEGGWFFRLEALELMSGAGGSLGIDGEEGTGEGVWEGMV